MNDEAQKMVALKKAYAEIILNTGKEAAARIMVSERKALRFQRDLVATKDEALRMLVRLKQMLDSKAAEAELTSLNQQRKIEELEAQMQEAEDVITNLRAELRRVEGELEKTKSDKVQPLNGVIAGEHGSFSINSTPHSVMPCLSSSGLVTVRTSEVNNMPTNGVLDNKCFNSRQDKQSSVSNLDKSSVSNLDKLYSHNSDIASIIMKRKVPELYRNGCTQRIRAFERNLLDGNLSPSGNLDNDNSLGKIESTVKVSDKNSLKINKTEMVEKGSRGKLKKPVKVQTSRKKKTRFGKVKTSGKGHHSQLTKTRPLISHFKRNSVDGNDVSGEGKCVMPSIEEANMDMTETSNGEEKLQHIKCVHEDEAMVIRKGKRQRKMRNRSDTDNSLACPPCQPTKPSEPSSVLSRCRTFEYLVNGGIKSGEDRSNPIENETKSLPCLDPGLTLIKSDTDPVSGSNSATLSVKSINKLEQISDAAEIMKETVSVKQESGVTENSISLSSSLNLDMINIPSVNSELKSEQLIKSPSRPDSNRLLKYTFQRKRKKEAANKSDELASPDKNSTKRKSTENECVAPDPQNSSLIDESSRDSRRLFQVARQLISLSGKRWR